MRCALLFLMLLAGCRDPAPAARAYRIESLDQAIGGPVASGRVGDYLLENERVRLVIEQSGRSRTPLGYGGSVVDADLVRTDERFRRGRGLDLLGQVAPTANLYLARADGPGAVVITGSPSGAEVTAKAEGAPIQRVLAAFNLLLERRFLDDGADYGKLYFYDEYELRPGEAVLRITTTVGFDAPFCPPQPEDGCDESCDDILYDDDCTCDIPSRCQQAAVLEADPLPDRPAPAGLSDVLLGDLPRPLGSGQCASDDDCPSGATCTPVTAALGGDFAVCRLPEDRDAGVLIGDMLLFGGHLAPFLPEVGFDTESDIRRLFDAGEDTLSRPLDVAMVAASGDGVSYAYGPGDGRVLIPIFGGPFSMGATAARSCTHDDPRCLRRKLLRSTRLLAVGRDISAAQAALFEAKGTPVASLSGTVLDVGGVPVSGADVFLIRDSNPSCKPSCTLEELFDANREKTVDRVFLNGTAGVVTHARTDPKGDGRRDGRFSLMAPPGDYFVLAALGDAGRTPPIPVRLEGEGTLDLRLPKVARLEYAIFDGAGHPMAGKIVVGAGTPLRPLELGGGRSADDTVAAHQTASGRGALDLPPGRYDVVLSRGPHYEIYERTVELRPGETTQVSATLVHQVDRTGYTAADFHVHAAPSLDSGTELTARVESFLAEDMDRLSSSDHDILTRYAPLIDRLGLSDRLASQVGVEVSTQELGHFIGYPLRYQERSDGVVIPGFGAPDWRDALPAEIFGALRDLEDTTPIVVDVPHPYSYFDAYALDPFTLEPTGSVITLFNPLVASENFDGNFDAMELLNSKGFDLIRRPTVGEVRFYAEGLDRLIARRDSGELRQAAFETAVYALSTEATRRMLHRTKAEQEAALEGNGVDFACRCGSNGDCAAGLVCDQSTLSCVSPAETSSTAARAPDDALCRSVRGVVDDWFTMLNRGVRRIGVGGSDVHTEVGGYGDAGSPRTLVETGDTDPAHVTDADFIDALRAGKVVVTNGPMIRFSIDGARIGDTLAVPAGRAVELRIQVERATWYDVDRVELYENGTLLAELEPKGPGVVVLDETIEHTPERDAWYAVIALGLRGRSLAPVYSSAALARFGTLELTQRIYDVIPRLRGLRIPRNPSLYPTFPFAITNPIWIDVDGDGWQPLRSPPSWCVPSKDYGCEP